MKTLLGVATTFTLTVLIEPVLAQAPMQLQWEHHDRPPFRSDGINYTFNGSWQTTGSAQPVDDLNSGKDWSYALTKIYAPPTTPGGPLGAHIAYAAVGYVGWANWSGPSNGCNNPTAPANDFEFPYYLGNSSHAPGKRRMGIAYYDLDGALLWYKAYYDEVLH
ncbi:MAG: hypothetical protein JNL43_06745 [Flavobacteriales bacterium]|nr:hypothetical protein [Flavobacteriales bacterium]